MLFRFFPFVGTVLFLLSEKCSSCHRKSTVPITGKRIIQFPVCRFLRLSVCKGNGYDGVRLIKS